MSSSAQEPTLFGKQERPAPRKPAPALQLPIARVVLDSPLAHIDRPFDYAVPADMDANAQPGVRVRVRWSGQLLDGFIVARGENTDHVGELAPLERVVSDERVLTPHIAEVSRQIADHYGGTLSDVLRLAIPPRHAAAEQADPPVASEPFPASPNVSAWRHYDAGAAFLRRLHSGEAPAAAWLAAPGLTGAEDWPAALAEAAATTAAGGRGAILVVPDHRDVERVCAALDLVVGETAYARLTADMGPSQRYRSWLSVLRGQRSIVIGTRAASYAPVANLGLFTVWDDGDDSLREQRTPYPHVLETGRFRSSGAGAGLLVGGFVRTPVAQQWVETEFLRPISPNPQSRQHQVRVTIAGEGHEQDRDAGARAARIPSLAWRTASEALKSGPVLVQVPRRGYGIGVSCAQCRQAVHCQECNGPTVLPDSGESPHCGWCGKQVATSECTNCGSTQRRVSVVGDRRTAEEIGRAFPGVRVRQSRLGQVLDQVDDAPAIIVATPGAEPIAPNGYAAALLLDGWALLDRPGLEAGIEATRRWMNAAALVRRSAAKTQIVLAGVPAHGEVRSVEALARWDPIWLARLDLADRRELSLPPARRVATVTGHPEDVTAASESLMQGEGADIEVLGPLPLADRTLGSDVVPQAQAIWRMAENQPEELLARNIKQIRVRRSMARSARSLVVVLDPSDLAT